MSFSYNCLTSQPVISFTMVTGTAPFTCTFVSTVNPAIFATGGSAAATGTVQGLPAGQYNVKFMDANGCVFTTIYQISVSYASANVVFSGTGSVTCFGGNTGSVIATPPNSFSGNIAYLWTPGGYSTPIVTGLSAGIYSLTVTDNKGCLVTNTVAIAGPTVPIESTLSNTYITCFGYTMSTPFVSTGNTGSTSYTLNGQAMPSSIAANIAAGSYTIITKDSKGCTATNTVLVDQGPQSLINFTIIKPSCPGTSDGSISPNIANALPAYAYTWQPGGNNGATLQNIPVGNYTLTLQDGNGCITRSATPVVPAASATISVLTMPENCSAADGAFTLNIAGANPPFTFNTIPYGPHPGATLTGLSSGNYTTVTNYNTICIDTLRFAIGNLSPVSVSIQNSVAITCYNACTGSLLLNVQNAAFPVTYSATGTPSTSSNIISNLCAGFYVIKVTDANGCPATTTVNFASPPAFSFSASGPPAACAGQQVSLVGTANGGSGSPTFIWNPGNITGQLVNVVPAGTTVYSLNAYDANGCTLAPVQVTVKVQPLISVAINSSNAGICPGTTAQITPTVAGGDGNYSYLWLPGNTTGPSIFAANVTVPVYTLVVKDGCGSPMVVTTIPINLFPVTKPAYSVKRNKGCEPFCTTFINLTPKSGNVIWNYGDKPYEQTGDTTSYCYAKAGEYDLRISLRDSNNCRTSFSFSSAIRVLESPKADFISTPARITLKTAENVLINNATVNGSSYQWFAGGKLISENVNTYYSFPDTGCYRFMLIARGDNFCTDTLEKDLCVEEDFNFYMPTCFTPNDNGVNDVLIPKGTGWLAKNYLFEVYTRWGQRLFKTTDIAQGWDGTNAGENTPYNSFIWRVVITDTEEIEHVLQGPVTVLR